MDPTPTTPSSRVINPYRVYAKPVEINDVVIYVAPGVECNALVVVNFEPEMRTPRLTIVYVKRRGEQGVAIRKYVPHELHREDGECEFWKFKGEN